MAKKVIPGPVQTGNDSVRQNGRDYADLSILSTSMPRCLPTVKELRRLNEKKWEEVKALHQKLNNEGCQDSNQFHDNGHGHIPVVAAQSSLVIQHEIDYVRAELKFLRERRKRPSSPFALSLAQRLVDARRRHGDMYAAEIGDSFEALVQADAVLEMLVGLPPSSVPCFVSASTGVKGDFCEAGGTLSERIRDAQNCLSKQRALHSSLMTCIETTSSTVLGRHLLETGERTGVGEVDSETATVKLPFHIEPAVIDGNRGKKPCFQSEICEKGGNGIVDDGGEVALDTERQWILDEFDYISQVLNRRHAQSVAQVKERKELALGAISSSLQSSVQRSRYDDNNPMNGSVASLDDMIDLGPLARKKLRRRQKESPSIDCGGKHCVATGCSSPAPFSSLKETVNNLTERLLLSISAQKVQSTAAAGDYVDGSNRTSFCADPYVALKDNARPEQLDICHRHVVNLLLQSGVAECHPNDENLIRMNNLL